MIDSKEIYSGCIGIDLGSSNSCVAIWENGQAVVIANEQGERTTPSVVAFTEHEKLVGNSAQNQIATNPKNTIFNVKRIIGRKFTEPEVQDFIKTVPYTICNNGKNRPVIKATYKNKEMSFSPEEISSLVLTKMKEIAEAYIGKKVKNAVITVPAYFNDSQRSATKDAAIIAGLEVLRIINEPTASSLCYGLEKTCNSEQCVLIYDFGGLTFDCTVLAIDEGVFEVKATNGNLVLGGSDIDNKLAEHFAAEFKRKTNIDISLNKRAYRRLVTACERCKKNLSSTAEATLEIDSLADGQDLYTKLSRARFEELAYSFFKNSMEPVSNVLTDAKLKPEQIHEIVLVGGTTRIPKIQKMLSEFFNNKQLNKSVNVDECVAIGAVIQGAILSGVKSEALENKLLLDVCPLSLGLETSGGIMTNVIPRNTCIPTSKTNKFSTAADNQPAIEVKIFEGERTRAIDNNLLGKFTLDGIPPMARGQPDIEITYELNNDGILNVTAEEKSKGKIQKMRISNDRNRLTTAQIEEAIRIAEKFAEEDEKFRRDKEACNQLETAIYSTKQSFEGIEYGLREELTKYCLELEDWLPDHRQESAEDYEKKLNKLQSLAKDVYEKKEGPIE